MAQKKKSLREEIDEVEDQVYEVERYEYLLLEYLKEMSNEITYLLIIICGLFLFLVMDLAPAAQLSGSIETLKTAFIVIIIGCFALFGLSSITKRRIEGRFKAILRHI